MERIPTYIWRLDRELNGGIPKNSVILIQGAPGTYKTSLSYYILYRNAKENGRGGVFITTDIPKDRLVKHLESMRIYPEDVDPLVKIVDIASMRKKEKKILPLWIDTITEKIKENIENAELLVIDNINVLDFIDDPIERRTTIFEFLEMLRDLGVTSILTSEVASWDIPTEYEHLVDGVLKTRKVRISPVEYQIHMGIEKMMYTKHSFSYYTILFEDGRFQLAKVIREEYRF